MAVIIPEVTTSEFDPVAGIGLDNIVPLLVFIGFLVALTAINIISFNTVAAIDVGALVCSVGTGLIYVDIVIVIVVVLFICSQVVVGFDVVAFVVGIQDVDVFIIVSCAVVDVFICMPPF